MRKPRGAARPGVLIVHETAPASYGWARSRTATPTPCSTSSARIRRPTTRRSKAGSSATSPPPSSPLRAPGFRSAKPPPSARTSKPVDAQARRSARQATPRPSVITSQNVVGLLPGAKRPDETVIYSAHWDHLGIGQPDANGDRIYNGALDNGTGVAQVLEQARAVRTRAAHRPFGRLPVCDGRGKGPARVSEYYAANPLYPSEQDGGRPEHRFDGRLRPGAQLQHPRASEIGPARRTDRRRRPSRPHASPPTRIPKPAASTVRTISPSPRSACRRFPSVRAMIWSMAGSSAARRWPRTIPKSAITSLTMNDSPTWDFSGIVADAQLLHAVGRDLANSNAWPNWSEDSEFRARPRPERWRTWRIGSAAAQAQRERLKYIRTGWRASPRQSDSFLLCSHLNLRRK